MKSVTRLQIQDEAASVSPDTNAVGKGTNPSVLSTLNMSK